MIIYKLSRSNDLHNNLKTVKKNKTRTQRFLSSIKEKSVVHNTSRKKLTTDNIKFLKSIGLRVKKHNNDQ